MVTTMDWLQWLITLNFIVDPSTSQSVGIGSETQSEMELIGSNRIEYHDIKSNTVNSYLIKI